VTVPTEDPRPSDTDPAVGACGAGEVTAAVVSMSQRHADGLDAEYLAWHVLDHLPEQYRLAGMRLGQRWVSTPACRAARAASVAPFDTVDHIVQYLFAAPVEPALEQFFSLGAALRAAGRMPIALPRVQVGGWNLERTVAAPRVLVGAGVVPWRPASGAYVLVEQVGAGRDAGLSDRVDALVATPGVAGVWWYSGAAPRHDRLDSTAGSALTVCYLDESPIEVAERLPSVLAESWTGGRVTPMLAGPFESVVPDHLDRHLP
jgi:hypothetical protein